MGGLTVVPLRSLRYLDAANWEAGAHYLDRHEGGCLCGRLRYATDAPPLRVTVCHCRFCQKATGSGYMVEPIFDATAFAVLSGLAKTYDQVSEGSGKIVHVQFCQDCGTKIWLGFERFPGVVGIYAGTFDDPCWFDIEPETAKHIFLRQARLDTMIPPGLPTFQEHAKKTDGTPEAERTYKSPQLIGR